ncbi:MAG: hypothetical protein AAB865_02570 [Patescibacteria group bacterium]
MDLTALRTRRQELGLSDQKYQFVHAPQGFMIIEPDLRQFEMIARLVHAFLERVDAWVPTQIRPGGGGSWWGSILQKGLPAPYTRLPWKGVLPETVMIDTVWTDHGWQVVEIDVTNRNGLGFPMTMRELYGLPKIWKGTPAAWREAGWQGVVQVMGARQRFYEPYFRNFLRSLEGELIPQADLAAWLARPREAVQLLDLPVLLPVDESDDVTPLIEALLERAANWRVAVPPVHQLSSKAVLALPWEIDAFQDDPIRHILPETRLVCRSRQMPPGDFFLKLLQSGGAHGTFVNDTERLARLSAERRPEAVWQRALPIVKRRIEHLDANDNLVDGEAFIRFSIYIDREGTIVDGDVTGGQESIVHGGRNAILTAPVLVRPCFFYR